MPMPPAEPTAADLARLRWAGDMTFAGYGARIGVRFTDRALGAKLAQRPAIGTRLAEAGSVDRMLSVFRARGRYWIFADGEYKCQPALHADLLDAFDTHLRAAFAEFSRKLLFVHGGVVGWKGRAIVFPGESRAGKTTLIAELVKAGASYFSDEYAVLDEAGRVHPFAKPLSLRETRYARQSETPVESLGGVAAEGPLPVGLVIMARYRKAARWQPEALSPGEAALAIMANTIAARRWPELALAVIGGLAGRVPVLRSERGEARAAVPAILAALEEAADRG